MCGSPTGPQCTADWWQDSLHPETARVLAHYTDGELTGRPAVIENDFGAGRVVYVGTRLPADALRDTVLDAVQAAGVTALVPVAPPHVEATLRSTDSARYLFLLNHSESAAATVAVHDAGVDLLTGDAVTDSVVLAPRGVAVVRTAAGGQ